MTWQSAKASVRRRGLTLALCMCIGMSCAGAAPAERRAFASAMRSFEGGWWEIAERRFSEFVNKYPESDLVPEAILRQAQARFRQRNFAGAVELLTTHRDRAGSLADEWGFWLGEVHFASSNYAAAAEAYSIVAQQFPGSKRAATAVYFAALAYARLGEWKQAVELLSQAAGPLQIAITSQPTNELAINSKLLLAEAQLATGDVTGAMDTLERLRAVDLPACTEWRRQYLLGKAFLRTGAPQAALDAATNLAVKAEACGRADLRAESGLFRATVLEHLGLFNDALVEYGNVLALTAPPEMRRWATLRMVELNIRQGSVDAAANQLENYLAQHPEDEASAAMLIAVGELRLKQFVQAIGTNQFRPGESIGNGTTNLVLQATAQFDKVITNASAGELIGKAWLGKGWCLWLIGKLGESKVAFEAAARHLPFSEDQAVARFKLADVQFAQGEFAGALSNYQAVARDFTSIKPVADTLLEPALYQTVRAALAVDDVVSATNAMRMIAEKFPFSLRAESALLLAGQGMAERGNLELARNIFTEFQRRYPDSPLLPQVRLGLARTFEQERNWAAAAAVYDEWVAKHSDSDLLPQVEYRRGLAHYWAGSETNALVIFTNLVGRFPTDPVAALAQNWVADFYFRLGDYKRAEEHYQLLYQRWPASELAFEAKMMAGRAAAASLRFGDAVGYFAALINDPNCPSNLVAQALFAYGDTLVRLEPADPNQPLANYEEAVRVFSRLQRLFPGSDLAILAWGRIGDCYLQLATRDANYFTNALAAYQALLNNPRADISARSQAEVGIGLVLDKQAQLLGQAEQPAARQAALEHYLRVAYQENLREGEQADPFWVKEAGLRAVRLAEELQMWEQLAKDGGICDHLSRILPQLAQSFEARKLKAKTRLNTPGP